VLLLQRRDGLVHHADLSSCGGPVHFARHPNPEPNMKAFKHVRVFVMSHGGEDPNLGSVWLEGKVHLTTSDEERVHGLL
jgi:hypothetical protein